MAAEGAKVVVAGRDTGRGSAAVAAIAATGGQAVFHRTDVTREADVRALVARATQEFGGLDLGFNNAGVEGMVSPITDYTADAAQAVLDTNVKGVFLVTKHAVPELLKRSGGAIVNTASFIGTAVPLPINAVYATSKAGLVAFTAALLVDRGGVAVPVGARPEIPA